MSSYHDILVLHLLLHNIKATADLGSAIKTVVGMLVQLLKNTDEGQQMVSCPLDSIDSCCAQSHSCSSCTGGMTYYRFSIPGAFHQLVKAVYDLLVMNFIQALYIDAHNFSFIGWEPSATCLLQQNGNTSMIFTSLKKKQGWHNNSLFVSGIIA